MGQDILFYSVLSVILILFLVFEIKGMRYRVKHARELAQKGEGSFFFWWIISAGREESGIQHLYAFFRLCFYITWPALVLQFFFHLDIFLACFISYIACMIVGTVFSKNIYVRGATMSVLTTVTAVVFWAVALLWKKDCIVAAVAVLVWSCIVRMIEYWQALFNK